MNIYSVDELEKVKRITIAALLADEYFMATLVLKGGNALNLAYNISTRGSIDIDFSIALDFSNLDLATLNNKVTILLKSEFEKHNYKVFDVLMVEKPKDIEEDVKEFWGGYKIEFKIVSAKHNFELEDNIEKMRRHAIPLHPKGSTKFTVDISKFEYVETKKIQDIEGTTLYVYTPEMLVLEKLRALCQQLPQYKDIVKHMNSRARARDFFDIHNLMTSFKLDFTTSKNIELARNIFEAKKVPLYFIRSLPTQYELHAESWGSVIQTIENGSYIKDFDYYYNYTLSRLFFLAEV
ncbi:nucleotidyl transferase AbiEii/AbiGii toxin family protein [soil metagenome]